MAKMPKAPKFQNLPTLEGLAARRGQTVAALLDEWNVNDADALVERLKHEGLAPVVDPNTFFKRSTPKVDVVVPPKKALKEPESIEHESKKPAKAKLSSDASDSGIDRAPSKLAVVVQEEAGKPSGKA